MDMFVMIIFNPAEDMIYYWVYNVPNSLIPFLLYKRIIIVSLIENVTTFVDKDITPPPPIICAKVLVQR